MKKFLFCILGGLLFCIMSANAQLTVNGAAGDTWTVSDFASIENSNVPVNDGETLVAKTSDVSVSQEGIISVVLQWTSGGQALWIRGVELLDAQNNVISYDYHMSTEGSGDNISEYKLFLTKFVKKIRYYAVDRGTWVSNGDITFALTAERKSLDIVDNSCTDTWEPAFWNSVSEVPAAITALGKDGEYDFLGDNIKRMENIAELKKGVYSFDFNYTSGQPSLIIGGVEIVDMNGNVLSSDYHYGRAGLSPLNNTYTVKLMQDGYYFVRYYCENNTRANASYGNIVITQRSAVDVNGANPVSSWDNVDSQSFISSNEVPAGVLALTDNSVSNVRVFEQLINVTTVSNIEVAFNHLDGINALDMAGVDLINENGEVVASHYKSDLGVLKVEYSFVMVKTGTYTMRAFMNISDGEGYSSKGDIVFDVLTLDVITLTKGTSEVGDWNANTFVAAVDVPAEIAETSKVVRVMTSVLNVTEPANITVDFPWLGNPTATNSLDVAGVDVIDNNGNIIAKDYHYTTYGWEDGNSYNIDIAEPGTYYIRYFNAQEGEKTRSIAGAYGKVKFTVFVKEFVATATDFSKDYYYLKNEEGKYLSTVSGAVALVAEQEGATKFYIEKNGSEYALLSFDKGLYLDFNASALSVAAVDKKYGFELGEGFLSGNSVIIKCGESYLANDLSVTNDINGAISWAIEEVESLNFSISSLRHASLYLPVEVEIPADVKVYIYTGIEYLENDAINLNLERIYDYIPANTAVLLYSAWPLESTTYFDFKISKTGAKSLDDNQFLGIYAKSTIKADSDKIYMYLTKPSGQEVGFYKRLIDNDSDGDGNADSFILGANKLYFTLPVAQAASFASRHFSLNFVEKGTTGVEKVLHEENTEKVIYDLQGRRVEEMSAPGIYIVNGNKVLVK